MSSKVSTNSLRRNIILTLFLLGIFLRSYHIEEMFSFNHDQEIAANASYDFFKNGKISIIGQELSFQGFFLGPLHNWIQFIPYGACALRPDCIPYFFALTGIITGLVFYQVAYLIFGRKIALISLLIYLTSAVIIQNERGPSSNYFLFLASTLLFFCLHKYYQGKNIFFAIGAFIGGLAVVNFNPIFIFTLVAYFIGGIINFRGLKGLGIALQVLDSYTHEVWNYRKLAYMSEQNTPGSRKYVFALAFIRSALQNGVLRANIKPGARFKTIFWSAVLAAVNILPLLIFNYRHDNIIYTNFVKFLNESASSENILDKFSFIVSKIVIPYYSNFYFLNKSIIFPLITAAITVFSFYYAYKTKQKIYIFLIIWILATVFGFIFYKRHIPDYYFIQTIPALIFLTAILLSKKVILFIIFIPLFLYANIYYLFNSENPVNYEFKKKVVDYVISDSNNKKFNVYFNFPQGQNTGFNYLFKINNRIPEDYAETLYILDFYEDKHFSSKIYYKSFGSNLLKITKIESMKIIKVKAESVN